MTPSPFMCWPDSQSTCPGRIRSRKRETGNSICSSGCLRAATGQAMYCWQTPRSSARCSAGMRAWKTSGRILPWQSEAISEKRGSMTGEANVILELDDIQSGVLRPRPTPYAATYFLVRIDDRKAGREMLRRVSAAITSAANPLSPEADAWVSIALTFQGLKALGVPQDSLYSFPPEFQQGMAARAHELGDVGENSPANWEKPFG